MKTAALSLDALRQAVARLPDGRLAPMRKRAFEQLGEQGLPTLRDEDWKYTDLTPIIDLSNQWLAHPGDEPQPDGAAEAIRAIQASIDAHWLVILNGEVDEHSLAICRGAGVDVSLLSDSDIVLESTTPLTQMNTALLRDGLRIWVDPDADLERPVGLLIFDDASTADGVSQARVEITMRPNSRASFIEYQASQGPSAHFANCVTNLVLGSGAEANFVRLQNRDRSHRQTGRLQVTMDSDSRFNHCGFDLGCALVRNDLQVSIDGPGAATSFDGLYLAGNGQHIDNHTRVDHRVGPAESRQEYRGILTGNARCIWNGKAIVHAGADGTDAAQANHNLLLSDAAEIDAKPELEIYADDVKCSHGTTVGQLDETSLYYLRTRGLDKQLAQQVLTRAFAQAIVSRSPVSAVEDTLGTLIEHRLGNLLGELVQ